MSASGGVGAVVPIVSGLTITMQSAMLEPREGNVASKLIEIVRAQPDERRLSKVRSCALPTADTYAATLRRARREAELFRA